MLNHYTGGEYKAGGKGTRLKSLTGDKIPKPLLMLNGKPMIQWQIENLKAYGVFRIIIIIGHLGEKIREYFGDGAEWGVELSYVEETVPLGSAGSLYDLKDRLGKIIVAYNYAGEPVTAKDLNGVGAMAALLRMPSSPT